MAHSELSHVAAFSPLDPQLDEHTHQDRSPYARQKEFELSHNMIITGTRLDRTSSKALRRVIKLARKICLAGRSLTCSATTIKRLRAPPKSIVDQHPRGTDHEGNGRRNDQANTVEEEIALSERTRVEVSEWFAGNNSTVIVDKGIKEAAVVAEGFSANIYLPAESVKIAGRLRKMHGESSPMFHRGLLHLSLVLCHEYQRALCLCLGANATRANEPRREDWSWEVNIIGGQIMSRRANTSVKAPELLSLVLQQAEGEPRYYQMPDSTVRCICEAKRLATILPLSTFDLPRSYPGMITGARITPVHSVPHMAGPASRFHHRDDGADTGPRRCGYRPWQEPTLGRRNSNPEIPNFRKRFGD